MPTIERIVLVCHCGPDSWGLRSLAKRVAPQVPVVAAEDQQALNKLANPGSLMLINRVLDGWFDTTSGIELISRLTALPQPPVCLLISNYPEAQEQAVAAGARPGFGKAHLHDPRTAALLRQALMQAEPQMHTETRG